MNTEKKFAILIDGENISCNYIKIILDEISNKGISTYKRIYGDWTSPNINKWKEILLEHSITPMQQYSYTSGKNSTDSAMIIDAMDILYTGKVDGFCLATSDSDFTKLASRLRESGMIVIGMGEQKTPRPFVAACDEFKFIDKLAGQTQEKHETEKKKTMKQKSENTSQTEIATLKKAIINLINTNSDNEGYMLVSDVGNIISKRYVDFDVRNYGYKKMVPFLESLGCFTIKLIRDGDNLKHPNAQIAYIKLKD